MTSSEILAHIEKTRNELKAAEKSSWEENVTAINEALDSSGFCTSPNARKALLALLETAYHRGYQEGAVYTVTKIMKDMGLGAIADMFKQPIVPKKQIDPALN